MDNVLRVTKVIVLKTESGSDEVLFYIEGPSSMPALSKQSYVTAKVASGGAEIWLKDLNLSHLIEKIIVV